MKNTIGILIIALIAAWYAYVIYGWITYTGAWQWVGEWEIQQFGAYREKDTLFILCFGPILVLSAPVYIINLIRPGTISVKGKGTAAIGRPAIPVKPTNPYKMLGAIAALAVVVGAGAGLIGYQKSQAPATFEPVDVTGSGTPTTRHINLSGIARTDLIVILKKTGGAENTEEIYLPVTPPNWRKGDPVSFFLNPHTSGYVSPAGFQMYRGSRPFPIQQTGTIFSDGLPGLVRTEFERIGIVMAPSVYMLDTKIDADLDVYFGLAFGSGLCLVVVLMTMLVVRIRRPR